MGEIVKVNAAELKSFDDKKFTPNVVYQSAGIKVVLAYFKTGQFIPAHAPGVDLVLYILEGEAEVVTGDERVTARKDDLIIVPKGLISHRLQRKTTTRFTQGLPKADLSKRFFNDKQKGRQFFTDSKSFLCTLGSLW
jgi:quercetin dioxygenase-like cupin family protein